MTARGNTLSCAVTDRAYSYASPAFTVDADGRTLDRGLRHEFRTHHSIIFRIMSLQTASHRQHITHAIFDLDGLLLDTEPFYTEVTQAIVGRYGRTFDWPVKSRMIGKKAAESARILVEALQLPLTPDDYLREREAMLAALFPGARPMAGARRLTAHLAQCGVPQAVATSSNRKEFALKTTQHAEWFSVFQAIVLGDDAEVRKGKPAPDIFLKAAERLGALPQRCLVFEDAPAGIEAARAAGMPVVAVPHPAMDAERCRAADQTLASLEFFDPATWGLPAFP